MTVIKFLLDIFNVFTKAKKIKSDSQARSKTVRFAVSGIVYSFIMAALAVVGALLFNFSMGDAGILTIFTIVISIGLLICFVLAFIGSLLRIIVQLTLNRRAMSWIALVVFIVCVIISVYGLIHFIG